MTLSRDGSRAVLSGALYGIEGPGSPDHPATNDRLAGQSIYIADTSEPPADSFAGSGGDEQLVNVCTGAGPSRTTIPARDGAGKLGEQACPEPAAGRNARLISPYGASHRPNPQVLSTQSDLNTVSADGSRVFFMSPDPRPNVIENPGTLECTADSGEATACPPQLYLRETDPDGSNPVVRWISKPAPGLLGAQDASLLGQALFEGASEDGDKVFFRTSSPLTADDPNGEPLSPTDPRPILTGTYSLNSWDLYAYDFTDSAEDDPGAGELTRISGGPNGLSDCNNPQGSPNAFSPMGNPAGTLRFASADGSKVYLVCSAPLVGADGTPPGGSVPGNVPGGTPTSTDFTNLYLYDSQEPSAAERWRFIARLPRAVGSDSRLCSRGAGGLREHRRRQSPAAHRRPWVGPLRRVQLLPRLRGRQLRHLLHQRRPGSRRRCGLRRHLRLRRRRRRVDPDHGGPGRGGGQLSVLHRSQHPPAGDGPLPR